MPRGRTVPRAPAVTNAAPILTDDEWGQLNTQNAQFVSPLVPHPSVLRILALARQIAERYVSGKHGLAIENASNEVLHLWDELPDEIRVML